MLSALLQYFVKNLQRCTQNNTKLQTLQKLQIPRQMLIPGPNNQQTMQKLYFPYNLETLHNLQFLLQFKLPQHCLYSSLSVKLTGI